MTVSFLPLSPAELLWISLIAGALITTAGMPKVYARYRAYRQKVARFDGWDIWRDALVGVGNALWVVFGIADKHLALVLFCGIQVPLMAALVVLNLRARKLERRDGRGPNLD
jgi:hypothetical protein